MNTHRSEDLFNEAQQYFPGGVNSPVRAFKAVGGNPRFIERGKGSRIYDADGNEFIDYVCSWGPLILGHAHPRVVDAVQEAAEGGTSFGAPTRRETELARIITDAMSSVELIRFVNSGTEATMSALRLARAYTGREKVIKFDGCYHGHADGLLVKAGSGALTLGAPDSPGVPASMTQNTISAPYNDLDSVERIFQANTDQIAAIILEPVAGNMGVLPPLDDFLAGLRKVTRSYGALLVFDEVITGFRVAYGGAQGLYGVQPDLTCLGKIVGGGLPVGAYGGRREVMEMLAPSGPVYQAGTLSGNPLAMSAGISVLRILQDPAVYETLENSSARLARGLAEAADQTGTPVQSTRVGSMMTLFFTDKTVSDYSSARQADTDTHAAFFRAMLERGVYLAPSQFECTFVSLAHTDGDIDMTVQAARDAFKAIA